MCAAEASNSSLLIFVICLWQCTAAWICDINGPSSASLPQSWSLSTVASCHCPVTALRHTGAGFMSISWSWARSELTASVMHGRPHLFRSLPLSLQFLHRYQIILLGDRGTVVLTSCVQLPHSSAQLQNEPQLFDCHLMLYHCCFVHYQHVIINDCCY